MSATMEQSADSCKLSLLTLNCWAIPYISNDLKERIKAIGEHMIKSSYDVCVLQEIWSQGDYNRLVEQTKEEYPYAHYFHSGATGSGVCLFSKFLIEDVVINRYSLNGYAYKFYHGDWFGGKLAGLCCMKINNVAINMYVTHVHAEYGRENDEYLAHRVAQILELCQFIRYTRRNADVTFVAGDMNVEPVDLGYRILLHHGELHDAWVDQKEKKDANASDGHTNALKTNCYTGANETSKRIDYLLYSSSGKYLVECEKCEVINEKVPGKNISLSDHEGVGASFTISSADKSEVFPKIDHTEREKTWEESLEVFDNGLKKTIRDEKSFYVLVILGLVLKFMIEFYDFPYGTKILIYITKLCIVIGIALCLWMALIMCRAERSGLMSATTTINVLKKANLVKKQK